ncbi:MAG: selenide,water dikinase [Paracoccaceae bacterium]|jgi:selenide,water dikinase
MQGATIPFTKDLVLIGGGHTHALVLRKWGMRPLPGVRLTLINPAPTAPYSGMLPGHIAGHYPRDALNIDLVRLARFAGARLILGAATGLDRHTQQIRVPGRAPIRYDIASIDIGITSSMPNLPGFTEHGIAAKPLDLFADRWNQFRAQTTPADVTVIGGGVAGVELAMAVAHQLSSDNRTARIRILEAARCLEGISGSARAKLLQGLEHYRISVIEGARAAQITASEVILEDGQRLASNFTLGAAGARPYPWLSDLGLETHDGFLRVDPYLRSINNDTIYAVGDCAHLDHAPRPKAGVFAVRQAPILFGNLRADLTGSRRKAFHPQRDYLKLISLGGRSALAEKFGFTVAGPAFWRWKNRIDQQFMDRFEDLKPMQPPLVKGEVATGVRAAMAEKPLCGGCGAKMAPRSLAVGLAGLQPVLRPDILTGRGDDAAVLSIGGTAQIITVDQLRAMTDDPTLLAQIAVIHAMGDVWAMGALPQAVLANIVLPKMAPAQQEASLTEIMIATQIVVQQAGAEIVGGHTSLGDEMSIGFTVTGLLADKAAITLDGGKAGDVLIVTKPIGTGVILAGEMALQARGDDVAACWDRMIQPQAQASAILRCAHAMTDVTGFGLAGHLMAICEASSLAATLDLAAIPVLAGAEALAASGTKATLYAANRDHLADQITTPDGPRADLLFDPQTCGGLLAAVAPDQADGILQELLNAGYVAARIGYLSAGPVRLQVH